MEITISNRTVFIDEEDWKVFSYLPWHIEKSHGYVVYRKYDKETKIKHKIYLHRLILESPDGVIDHINHNKLDNRRKNLRVCTYRRNILNQYRECGVSQKKDGRWRAYVTITGKESKKQIHLGYYQTKEEAVLASSVARTLLQKVYAFFDL